MNSDNNHKRASQKTQSRRYKRCTETEKRKILDFLKKNQPIMKPTAKIYYSRLMAEHNNIVVRSYKSFRCKVGTMEMQYFKLKKWAKSEEAEKEKSQLGLDSVEELLLQKCPLYYEMEEAFGKRKMPEKDLLIGNQPIGHQFTVNEIAIDKVESYHEVESNDAVAPATAMQALTQMLTRAVRAKREKLVSDLEFNKRELHVQREMLQLQKAKFLFEKKIHIENSKLETKELAINKKYKIMEQKMKEKIALREREMNERIEQAKIKNTIIKQEEEFLLE